MDFQGTIPRSRDLLSRSSFSIIEAEDFIAYCNASKKGLGAVLMQREKETSATEFNDHKSLHHILIRKELNMRQRRWKNGELLRVRALVMTIGLDLPKQILIRPTSLNSHIHPGSDMMYQDMKEEYTGGPNMKANASPPIYAGSHNNVSCFQLKKCYSDEPSVVLLEGLQVDDKLHFVKEPVEIMDREVKQLRRSHVPIVKVRWNSRRGPEFTWEHEDQFRKKYPFSSTKTAQSSSVVS
ncbi:hypothetical protein Tco_1063470 [Tanacetum coccineum]